MQNQHVDHECEKNNNSSPVAQVGTEISQTSYTEQNAYKMKGNRCKPESFDIFGILWRFPLLIRIRHIDVVSCFSQRDKRQGHSNTQNKKSA